MKKADLIKILAEECSLSRKESAHIINIVFQVIRKALLQGECFHFSKLGTLFVSVRKSYVTFNVVQQKKAKLPKQKTIKFSPSKTLKKELNSKT